MRFFLFFAFLLVSINCSAHPPWGIVVDDAGNIYFTDIQHNGMGTFWKFTKDRKLVALRKDFHAHNVSLDRHGNLYSAHGEGNHYMIRISPNGKIDTLVNTENLNKFFGGNATVSPNGQVYFGIEKYIWLYNRNGTRNKVNKEPLGWNQAVMVDENEHVYASDIDKGNGQLTKFTPTGKTTVLADNLITKLDRPRDKHNDILLGMAKDSKGFVYICETAGNRIVKIGDNKQMETFYTSEKGWMPSALYFKNGTTYILEWGGIGKGPQVVTVSTNGAKKVIFNFEDYHN
jgi:streptogramin lyase